MVQRAKRHWKLLTISILLGLVSTAQGVKLWQEPTTNRVRVVTSDNVQDRQGIDLSLPFDTLAGLTATSDLQDKSEYRTRGRDATHDGGGATYLFELGSTDKPDEGLIVTAPGGRLRLLRNDGRVNPLWYPGSDIGAKINAAFAAGGNETHVIIPPVAAGALPLTTTIDMSEAVGSHLVLEGSGYIATTLEMPALSNMIGIDMCRADESEVRHLRITEGRGGKTCIGIVGGGTTSRVRSTWVANMDISYLVSGAGFTLTDIVAEHSNVNLQISTRYASVSRGIPFETNNARKVQVGGQSYLFDGKVIVKNYRHLTLADVIGTPAKGDIIAQAANNVRATVVDAEFQEPHWKVCVSVYESEGIVEAQSFRTTGGASGTISKIESNLLAGISIHDTQIVLDRDGANEPALQIEHAQGIDLDVQLMENRFGGARLRNVKGFNLAGIADRNAHIGVEIEGGYGTISGFIGHNAVGNMQRIDVQAHDCDITFSGVQLRNGICAFGTSLEAAASNLRVHDILEFDGDDAIETASLTDMLWDHNDRLTVEFNLLKLPTQDSYLVSYGKDASHLWAVTYVSNRLHFVISNEQVIRVALMDAPQVGRYRCEFDKAGNSVLVRTPGGNAINDIATAPGIVLHANASKCYIGKRPVSNDQYFDGLICDIVIRDHAGTIVHRWNGHGDQNADWVDRVGTADGRLEGTNSTTSALQRAR